jgi:pimeloyl-ACP methyl ester carboxylesterase
MPVSLVPVYFTEAGRKEGARLLAAERPSARLYLDVSAELVGGKIPSAVPALAALKIPKVVIAGAEDGMVPAAILEADAAATGASFHRIDHASHFVHVDRPRDVARLLEALLRSPA